MDPLRVEHVRLGTRTATRQLPRFHQVDLEALRFQQLEQSNPVDAGGFQSDRSDPALLQPRDDLLKIGGVGAELADRVGVTVGGDADHMHVGMHIDSGRVRVDDLRAPPPRRGRGQEVTSHVTSRAWLASWAWWASWALRLGRPWDVSGSRMRVSKPQGAASQEGYRGRWKSPQRNQYHAGKTRHGKSPMTRSKPLGPSFASGKMHQKEYGHGHASPDHRVETSSDPNQISQTQVHGPRGCRRRWHDRFRLLALQACELGSRRLGREVRSSDPALSH